MAPPRVHMAINAMKAIGIPPQTAKPVLKRLLKAYGNNWTLIEDENYRVLADAIFDIDDSKRVEENKNEACVNGASEPPRKRCWLRQEDQSLPSISSDIVFAESSLKRPKFDGNVSSQICLKEEKVQPPQPCTREKNVELISTQSYVRDKRADSVPQQTCLRELNSPPALSCVGVREKRPVSGRVSNKILNEANIKPCVPLLPKSVPDRHQSNTLIKLKSEPFNAEFRQDEVPITVNHPPIQNAIRKEDSVEASPSQYIGQGNEDEGGIPETACENGIEVERESVSEASAATFEIASTTYGEVKLFLHCNSAFSRSDFHAPDPNAVLRLVEDKCLRSYRILEPTFSVKKLMKELCQCLLELSADSNDKQETHVNITPTLDLLKQSNLKDVLGTKSDCISNLATKFSNGSPNIHYFPKVAAQVPRSLAQNKLDGPCHHSQPSKRVLMISNDEWGKKNEIEGSESSMTSPHSLVPVETQQFSFDDIKPLHDVNDITKGHERVRISVLNEVTSELYPPSFYYIPQNIVYQNAYINLSLARIGDEDCCSECFGDCLSSAIPCACARETGGEYAYTPYGLLKKEFLDECISMNHNPKKNRLFYCNDCPLERTKNEVQPEPCKGHLVGRFVKECWSKCGCSRQCGNRVIQRGITCNLQVYLASEDKGWGLRTLQELPRGTFVCEYVGEIVTNTELYDRTIQTTGNDKHTYPVLLDADWGSEGVLKDEEALCLDATFYGNVARFINHRCFDANLIGIPVEIETPDHHYYHLAFFTTRNVQALEELTWDYGIDFEDQNHPIEAFKCCCGSHFCRDLKPPTRTKSTALILR
ncbi:putative inactive histone-lysine N-methyltransferase SUVR2 [Cinnamomum micranthum f. kanehirae]|uniref:Putative inactive histone-lysine N-methyltransferase SUVR2 n=1 Tax=Cinnamomum micranthum f. kanehirae TaxID=337451 RepID=A0A443NRS2_9MAGN|nr:putative inactive histone-lysine N-methyltransferase SUVR2 [Cinnamomum micranthum f. kanehirae]